jgi:hypothetical protein
MEDSSAFAPENFGPVVLIQLNRLYDIGMALLSVFDADKAALLVKLHEDGHTFTPPPAFVEFEESNEESMDGN